MGVKISVVIPHWPFSEEIDDTLKRCVDGLSGYDELIVAVNEGTGFAKAVNTGMRLSKGEYIAVVNNDIEWKSGDLSSLCVPGTVTSPRVNGVSQCFWGCFFVVPRDVYEKIGGLDERFGIGYYEDDDYLMRLKEAGIPLGSVDCRIETKGGATMSRFDVPELMRVNREKFDKKWNI